MRAQNTNASFSRHRYYSPNPARSTTRKRPLLKTSRSGSKHIVLKLSAGLTMIVLTIVGVNLYRNNPSSGQTQGANVIATAAPEPAKPTITQQLMTEKVNQIIAANPGVDISVTIADPKDNTINHFGTEAVYEAASVAKVLTGVFYLHDVQKGNQSLERKIGNTTARANLQLMIEQSDNAAWKTFNDILDRDRLLEYARSIGFSNYNPKVNTFTSDDIAHLLLQLQQGKLLNYENTQLILGHMKNASRSEYLRPALPPEATLYHKAGWLEDRIHDAAIIDDGHRPYVLVIFTKGRPTGQSIARELIMQQITKVTTARFISAEYL